MRKLPFIFGLFLIACPFSGQAGDNGYLKINKNVCDITGIVSGLEVMFSAPTAPQSFIPDEDTPAAAATGPEKEIFVKVNTRKPHYKDSATDSLCNRGAKGETISYKLCSITSVRAGDSISATEGAITGKSLGCLFDLQVIPK